MVSISASIIALLTIVYFSYRQTIQAYPGGGGSCTVARQNLGVSAGLLAAAALMIDYVLVVAVGISAGVGALVSSVPSLQPNTLALCLGILVLITVINLRGVRETGTARANADSRIRFAAQVFLLEVVFLSAASFRSIGYRSDSLEDSYQPFVLIAFMALAMGTRNAAVRRLAIPDLTTTVLTLTVTGIAADSSLAKGNNPRLARRVGSVLAIFFGAAFGAVVIRYSISAALWLGTAISGLCSAALFRALRTPDKPVTAAGVV